MENHLTGRQANEPATITFKQKQPGATVRGIEFSQLNVVAGKKIRKVIRRAKIENMSNTKTAINKALGGQWTKYKGQMCPKKATEVVLKTQAKMPGQQKVDKTARSEY